MYNMAMSDRYANKFQHRIAILRKKSRYYPLVIMDREPDQDFNFESVALSTLVRINRDGIWYVVHCVEIGILNNDKVMQFLNDKFMTSVHLIQNLYQLCGIEEIDVSQEDEVERLKKSYGNPRNTNPSK